MVNDNIFIEFKLKLYINGKYNARRWKSNYNLREWINKTDFGDYKTLDEKIWALRNDMPMRPVCNVCGGEVNLRDQKTGFRNVCSQKCSGLSKNRKEKIKNTSMERYGVEHPTKSEKYRTTIKENINRLGYHPGGFNTIEHKKAIQEKYGVDNIGQSTDIKDKMKSTFQQRYGVNNAQQILKVKEKKKKTNIQRYGQDGFNPTKTKQTLQKKYGVDNPLKSEYIRNKIKNTLLERYGVEHPMQNPEIYEKCITNKIKGAYKFKEYVSPSGKKYRVQGYEGHVIDYLLKAGINENDLTNLRIEIPVIEYNFDNKKRIYYPDIFIRSKNMLIEVKSTYTYMKEVDKNLAKQNASKGKGYHHIIIIWDKKNDHIFQII